MPQFASAAEAYRWAAGVLHLSRGAKTGNLDPDQLGQKGIHGDYNRLDAIQIVIEAEEVCKQERGCWTDPACLLRWCIPSQEGFGYWTEAEKARVNGCLKELEKRLLFMNYIDYNVVAGED